MTLFTNLGLVRLGLVVLAVALMGSSGFGQDDGQEEGGPGAQTLQVQTGGIHFFKVVVTESDAVVLDPGAHHRLFGLRDSSWFQCWRRCGGGYWRTHQRPLQC